VIRRVFTGWDGPFLHRAASWLLEERDALPRRLVVVPTSQSGRRLREALAAAAGGALLSPRITTPGGLLATPGPDVAADWMEQVAWTGTLEGIASWDGYADLFPLPPEPHGGWAAGLAIELVALRRALQENGHTLATAARALAGSVEAGRWQALARLEQAVEDSLRSWGMRSRSRVLADGLAPPAGIDSVVLAGVTGMPPLVGKSLAAWGLPVTALIAAPETEADAFSPLGLPLECWSARDLPWPDGAWGSVRLAADLRQEAAMALHAVAQCRTTSDEVALGTADTPTGDELARGFTRAGWTAFHPAAHPVAGGLSRWFKPWRAWLADPRLAHAADLLAMPETAALLGAGRAAAASRLARLRDAWMIMRPDDLRRALGNDRPRDDRERDDALAVLRTVEVLEHWRSGFAQRGFAKAMAVLLEALAAFSAEAAAEAARMRDWITTAGPLLRMVRRDEPFWIDLMLGALPVEAPQPPDGRVIDVQGWLELLFEPGRHLVLCGMNEGIVPARDTGDPWLGEAARRQLGLTADTARAARDAYLYQAMLEARRNGGRADVSCVKSGPGGEVLLPSRLLTAAPRDALPVRVKELFRNLEPPEAGMRWHADWKWQPRAQAPPDRISVTSFSTWLACPFRFYLKHILRMQGSEPGREEWSARDFGDVAHGILERWGCDAAARELADAASLSDWFSAELDRVTAGRFGLRPPVAVRVQAESLRQRLGWFARLQAGLRADGWRVIEAERKFEFPLGGFTVSGKIDRIDRHEESGALRVIDYKTGKVEAVESEHRKKITSGTRLPAHLPDDCPVHHHVIRNDKPAACRWINLQLPLYARAFENGRESPPSPCYIRLGASEPEVLITEWADFSAADLSAAEQCAEWILGRIAAGVFWPPAEKPLHDDYKGLAAGRALAATCMPPQAQPVGPSAG
jgi:ATP-dependent helicase/nuclease subunit B